MPQCLDLLPEKDFLEQRSHQVPVIFTDPLFVPGMANAVYKVFKPPMLSKASPFTGGSKVPSTSAQPEDGGPGPKTSAPKKSVPEMSAPSSSETSQQVQEETVEASDTDSNRTEELTSEKEPPPQVFKVKLPARNLWKRNSKAMAGKSRDGATPSKVRKEKEANDAETAASTGPSEAALQTA